MKMRLIIAAASLVVIATTPQNSRASNDEVSGFCRMDFCGGEHCDQGGAAWCERLGCDDYCSLLGKCRANQSAR